MSKISWVLITILMISSTLGVAAADRWQLIIKDELVQHYFDATSIKIINDSDANRIYFDVWIKVTYQGVGKEIYRESLRKAKIPTNGYENFSYVIHHVLFEADKICLLGVYDYTDQGLILRSFDAPIRRWMDIVPDSTIEVWYEHIISYALANLETVIKKDT